MSWYDDIDQLLRDLETERIYKEQLEIENSDLEKTIVKNEGYLRHMDGMSLTGSAEDSEWKCRYENQKELNSLLSDQQAWLEGELAEMEWKYETRSCPDVMTYNADLLTELELVRLVKHMERVKTDYYGTITDTDFMAEKEIKEFLHFDEIRRTFKYELGHCSLGMDRTAAEAIMDRQAAYSVHAPPLFSPSYLQWLDSQPLESPSSLKLGKSKHRSKRSTKSRKKEESENSEQTTGTEPEGNVDQAENTAAEATEEVAKEEATEEK